MATTCDINGKKPEINYPCNWEYKLIILANSDIKEIAQSVLKGKEYTLKSSKQSKAGKYQSFNLSILVNNEDEREAFFRAFKAKENIKFVL